MNAIKLYAAYKAGVLGNNILDTYFSFIANMLIEDNVNIVEDHAVRDMFEKRYHFSISLPFIRQVLGVGVINGSFVEDHGKFSVMKEILSKYSFDTSDFDSQWNSLKGKFKSHCNSLEISFSENEIDDFILQMLDASDELVFSVDKIDDTIGLKTEQYAWYSFVKTCAQTDSITYTFISALSASNITKQALFYSGTESLDLKGLNVYLDSPMIFALLGMDVQERTESYKKLISDIQNAGGNVHVLDNNFQEVDGIVSRAAGWAVSTGYDIRLANNAARFFHDSQMTAEEISEFCATIEDKLNSMGITQKTTDYDIFQNQFQEDETTLNGMIKDKYKERGYVLTLDKQRSIETDVRSIIMIYRERQGQVATRIENSKHIMLTSNNMIANISKKFESNMTSNPGHIPACISADLFGAILWLNSPIDMMGYQQKKLLADCYGFLQPDSILLNKYIESLDVARKADKIDEKKFLFLRTHPVVLDSLMNITHGDYARFSSSTYLEVYEDIVAESRDEYQKEAIAHKETKKQLEEIEKQVVEIQRTKKESEKEYLTRIETLENTLKEQNEKKYNFKINTLSWICSIILFGVPYVVLIAITEILKARFSDFTPISIICIAGLVLVGIVALFFFQKRRRFWNSAADWNIWDRLPYR